MENKYHVHYEYIAFHNAEFFTVVCLPDAEGSFPTVVARSPYGAISWTKEEILAERLAYFKSFLDNGYAVVYQDCRGCGQSTGDCIPYIHEREDGLFLQDWIRKQPFYNGELYLWGRSYGATVHFVTAPFAEDIKGAVLEVQDTQRYNCNYRNGFYKIGLHGNWYVGMYKKKTMPKKDYTSDRYNMLPLSKFSETVFGEKVDSFDAILQHPKKDDPFWKTRFGGGEADHAIRHANIPILLVTSFYDLYTDGVFDVWEDLDPQTKSQCALAVNPFNHGGKSEGQPIAFPMGEMDSAFPDYAACWFNAIRGGGEAPFPKGKVTYYNSFENAWCCDDFETPATGMTIPLGAGEVTYRYDPNDPATFKGGLSGNGGGTAWQDPPHQRDDIITLYSPVFTEDTLIKGKMQAKLKVRSSCEDTCFYIRISLCKAEGDYGLRDDIHQISNFCENYVPGSDMVMDFTFDRHAFMIAKGEKLRIDISSSAFPHYVRHTNYKGLFSMQETTQIAENTVILEDSSLYLPIV